MVNRRACGLNLHH